MQRLMLRTGTSIIAVVAVLASLQILPAGRQEASPYFPPRHEWARKNPEEVGMNSALLQKAVEFSIARENPETKDLALALATSFGREPFGDAIGPTRERGALNGLIICKGYLVADWGGGMFIDAHDMARFGYLFLRNGRWRDRQIVSEEWIKMARTPGPANRNYGYMNWFLNTDQKPLPAAPASSVTFQGNGANIIYIDWDNDVVVVVRWIRNNALNEFIGMVLGSLQPSKLIIE